MANRRKFLAGLGALASGSAAAVGTGAFTSVTADRSLEVETADDASAFLAIEAQDTPNGSNYAGTSGAGTITLDFSQTDSPGNGQGLNKDATTTIRDILKVSNQGSTDVVVGVSNLPSGMSVYTDDGSVAANGNSTSLNQDNYNPKSGNLALVEAGEVMNNIGVIFRDPPNDLDFDGSITFNAIDANELDEFDASQYPDNI
jgi:opacity protein-like surface antigen